MNRSEDTHRERANAHFADAPTVPGEDALDHPAQYPIRGESLSAPEGIALIVDPDAKARAEMRAILAGSRLQTLEAASAREAFARLSERGARIPQVILSAWVMPEMDGIEFCRALRRQPDLRGIHFILMTTLDNTLDVVRALDLGVDDFLVKPVNPSELRARLQLGLRLHSAQARTERLQTESDETAENLRRARDGLRQAHEKLDSQMREFAELQASFLPRRFPAMRGLAFAAFCRPCYDVGGDYYDAFYMPDGRLCVTIADVTGHGARAAVLMAMTRSLTRASSTHVRAGDGPRWLLTRINRWLCAQLVETSFVTMWMGVWDPVLKELRFSRAGHPPAILWRRGGQPELLSWAGSPPLGLSEFPAPPEEEAITLEPGDRLALYTDGWIESSNAEGKQLEMKGFMEMLLSTDGLDLESIPLHLNIALERHVANSAITDDISLLMIERLEEGAPDDMRLFDPSPANTPAPRRDRESDKDK